MRHLVLITDLLRMPQNRALRVEFVHGGARQLGTFDLVRNLEPAVTAYQTPSSHCLEGIMETFVTVLTLAERDNLSGSPAAAVRLIEPPELRAGVGVLLELNTDASFFFARMRSDSIDWATGLGAGKWRYWEGTVERR